MLFVVTKLVLSGMGCNNGVVSVHPSCRVPTRTGNPGKAGRHFPVREKSGNFEQTCWEFQTNVICYFLVIFKLTMCYLLNWIKFLFKNQNT